MDKKDYKKIAEIIKKQHIDLRKVSKRHSKEYKQLLEGKQTGVAQIREDLADYFESTNKFEYGKNQEKIWKFNREQFLKDCGVK